MAKLNWFRILLFFALATFLSYNFRFDIFELRPLLERLPTWQFVCLSVLLEGGGVFLAALLGIALLRRERPVSMSLLGLSKKYSLLLGLVPLVLLTGFGVANDYSMDQHMYGFIAAVGTLIYCVFEEYGWRGYLQEEVKELSLLQKSVLIGLLWYLWHLSFLMETSIGDNAFFLAMLIFGSWGIGQVADLTKSILACAYFHFIVQIMMFNALIKNGLSGNEKIMIIVIAIVVWGLLSKSWKKVADEKGVI